MIRPLPMTPGRWVALAIGTPLALLAIGWTALTVVAYAGLGSYRVNLTVPVQGHSASVSVDSGEVSVGPGPPGRVQVHGTVHYSLVRPRITWQRTPSGVALRSRCRLPTGECSINFAVTLPARGSSGVSLASGDVTARDLAGPLTLRTDSGDIRAARISGHATLSDQSGDIVVNAMSSPQVLVRNSSGNITCTGLSSQDVTVSDHSGDITLVFTRVPDRVRVSNNSGNVTLVLPNGPTAYRVSASTSSGQTTIGVPRNDASRHVITVTDQSGDIAVT